MTDPLHDTADHDDAGSEPDDDVAGTGVRADGAPDADEGPYVEVDVDWPDTDWPDADADTEADDQPDAEDQPDVVAEVAEPVVEDGEGDDLPAEEFALLYGVDGDGAPDTGDAADAQQVPTPADGRRPSFLVSNVAAGIAFMATGGLIAVLTLYIAGSFAQADSGLSRRDLADALRDITVQTAPLDGGEPAPVTGDDIAADESATPPTTEPDLQVADPARVQIPAIGVDASVIELGTLPDGALEVPEDFSQAGWWAGGPEPGEIGPAVVVGHVDSFRGPAVFYSLDELAFDDAITITRVDGSSATFAVRSTINVQKDEFPTDLVYGDTEDAQLRLITCDGDFADGSYLGNLIITAELVRESPPPAAGVVY